MKTLERELRYVARHLPKAKAGDRLAISNVAAAYRILGRHSLAYRWWKKGAELGDGSDTLDVGYCYQHGAGVQRDARAAIRAYGTAIQSDSISQLEREEAMYLLAVSLMPRIGRKEVRARIVELLGRANADDDYPQAAWLVASLESPPSKVCTCRRGLRFGLARSHCAIHNGFRIRKGRTSRSTRSRAKTRAPG